MKDDSCKNALRQARSSSSGPHSNVEGVRGRIREWIEALVEAQLTAALGTATPARGGSPRARRPTSADVRSAGVS